ncbi:hypothetical protein EMN47_03480 [Prolixibacteraceae bacterium JC049]|nr:hypothetical protein [Prolixibacteraceae bacterium JC049]
MKKLCLATILLVATIMTTTAQDNFQPSGKPFAKLFGNFHSTFSDGENASAFELKRAYLGYEYKFSPNWSAKANFDIGNPGVGKHEMAAYIKNAYAKYQKDGFKLEFGMISTKQFKVQEKFWGYRYIEKSFQDAYKFNSSADLGIAATYQFSKSFSADIIIANGEGYKKIEGDSILRTGIGATFTPVKGLTLRGYTDFMKDDATQTSYTAFVGYQVNNFSIGAEYNLQQNNRMREGHDFSGVSFYSTLRLEKVKLFARFDNLTSEKVENATEGWNVGRDGQLILAGFEFSPIRGIKVAPNYRGWNSKANNQKFASSFYLNCEIKF